jgi:hypothetical protein
MKSLRDLAHGKPCYLRLYPYCNGDNSTTVLAHIRRGSVAGVGQKPCDIAAMPMCSACHDVYDGRVPTTIQRVILDAEALRGLVQWLDWLDKREYIIAVVAA